MTQGFALSTDEIKVAIIVKRLTPAICRKDEDAVAHGVAKMRERYGSDLVGKAFCELIGEHDWLMKTIRHKMPADQVREFDQSALDVLAQVLEDAGLRIEDHIRSSDQGFILTKRAIEVVRATGYPRCLDFGDGVETLDNVGLSRSPFMHRLSEIFPATAATDGEQTLNLWATASMIINAAMDWLDEPPDEPDVPLNNLKAFVMFASPTADIEKLMFRARYDDASLLRLASLANQGLQTKADRAFEQ